jgi:hypothetical protein
VLGLQKLRIPDIPQLKRIGNTKVMSGPAQPLPPKTAGYEAGSLIVQPRPNEFPFPMRESEFQILCEGEISEARAARDLYIGICIGAVVGLVSVFATTDWSTIWQPERRWPFCVFVVILFMLFAGSVVGICIHHARLKRTRGNSPYSRLKRHVEQWFASRPGHDEPPGEAIAARPPA